MNVERNIKGIEIDVDINESSEIYLPQNAAELIKDDGLDGVVEAIYISSGEEYLPLSVFIELTDCCNFSCPFCYINEKGKVHSVIRNFDSIKETLDFLISKGMLYCTLSGGECLAHPDFKLIYTYLKEKGVLVTVFSNGYLIDEDILEMFERYKPFKVEISLYGIDDMSYSRTVDVTGIDSSRVFRNILSVKDLGVEVICKTPITSLTETIVPLIEEWCDNHSVPFYSGYEVLDTYYGTDRKQYLASEEMRRRQRTKSDEAFYNDPHMIDLMNDSPQKKLAFDCNAGRTELFISAKYELSPCMKAIGIPDWTFDIDELGIEKAYVNLITQISNEKNKPLQYCDGCNHHKICQECFFTQYEYTNIEHHRMNYCKSLSAFCNRTD